MGILCKHALKLLNYVKVHSIPKRYLKKRWMKNIRNRVSDEGNGSGCETRNNHVSEMVFSNYSKRWFYDLTMRCKVHEETRNMMSEFLDKTIEKTNAWFENSSLRDSTYDNFVVDEDNEESNEMLVRNPLFVKSRGITKTSIQSHWDEKSKKENYGEDAEAIEQYGEHFESPEPSLSKHQEVHSVSLLIHELENRLAIGQVMKSVEDTYLLYCKCAHAKGFSVRKGDQKYFPCNNEIQEKELECSCEGVKDERRSRGRISDYQKSIIRTKCKGRIEIGIDYEYFGDVLSVDTTYKTNQYDLICAAFVGLNPYKQNVMFGLAFMSKETQESFARFKEFWYKCMNHYNSEEEFEATWRKMIHEYNLSGDKWLNRMYKLRQKWAKAFSKDRFSAGLLATSRSEVHSILERYLKKRWMKNIRNRVSDEGNGSGCESGRSHVSEMVFSNYSMRQFYDLTMRCKAREETRNMLSEFLDKTIEKMNAWFENLSLRDSTYDNFVVDEDNEESNEMLVRDPLFVKLREITNDRIHGHWDEKSKKEGIAKSTKQKEQISETAINEFPSQEDAHASMSQEATNVQLSSYTIHYPIQ
ncbi:hypothetical protein BUALT_Bualt09G0054700 [Buddleja alternifolia]|uniref:Protein FAR1-RELATED SEQUENCE n=1 Tax=Buddleja alternifolia TaxID=168488 RepID=A0AAV6X7E9_9LAMI|nr:hypothetical protein BUALT_Bualt09G0054700 [Buddleja alternifolia]